MKHSQNRKQERSWTPGPLTRQEIESLRQDKKAAHEANVKFFRTKGLRAPEKSRVA